MEKSENVNELFTALSKAQAEIKGAIKDSSNPFFKSNYADLKTLEYIEKELEDAKKIENLEPWKIALLEANKKTFEDMLELEKKSDS